MTDFVIVNGVRLPVATAIARVEDISQHVKATISDLDELEEAAALKRVRIAALQDARDPYLEALASWRRTLPRAAEEPAAHDSTTKR